MTNLKWPDIPNPIYPLKTDREDNVIRSNTDSGYEITRQRYTRTRKSYELKWTAISQDDRDTIVKFYDTKTASGSLSFTWYHPVDGSKHEVRFSEPIQESLTNNNIYSITVKIKEV